MTSETISSPSKEAVLNKAALNAAKHLELSHAELAKLLRISEASLLQCVASEGFLDPSSHEGERALTLVQIFGALDALVGGDAGARVTWMNAHNQVIGDLPRNAIQTFSGLVHTLAYLNNLIAATSDKQASRLQ